MIELYDYQLKAIDELRTGSILCGGVGSGKSITALAYYLLKDTKGSVPYNGSGDYAFMEEPRDLYIITTAKKRDSLEWEEECAKFSLSSNPEISHSCSVVKVDSWNNVKKYRKIYGQFFIFDEQRVVGSGSWVKSFLDIARKNHWILLSATPGDQWSDYIPVFIANGFYKSRTEFHATHCVFSRYSKYPKIERYVREKQLEENRKKILVVMKDNRSTTRHEVKLRAEYDKELYRTVFRDRWDPYENEPIQEVAKMMYLIRRVVNSDPSRIERLREVLKDRNRCIVFYNFSYELELLRRFCEEESVVYAEWNGKKHQELPEGESWLYLVQYTAGSEGWNCITTDTVVFYSQSYSYRMTEQAMGRIDRINTPYQDLYYYKIRSTSPIDLAIGSSLSHKKDFNERSFVKRRKIE